MMMTRQSISILIATRNQGKVEEISKLLHEIGLAFPIRSLSDQGIEDDFPETGQTFLENASGKALFYNRFVPDWLTIADDSGLMVDALNGEPGVYSARYSGPDATDARNNSKLLKNLAGIEDRSARFVTTVSLARHGRILASFDGDVKGQIIDTPRGQNGFGYDPIFFYPPQQKTFAELSTEVKNRISHRAEAIRKLISYLKEQSF